MINIHCCFRLKSKQISELFQKCGFNGPTGDAEYTDAIGYADYNYDIVNNI